MASSLASQLAQIAANSKATLNTKAQKAAHSKSLIWEPKAAACQSYQALYTICYSGFEELCQLDARFLHFQSTIFSQASQDQDRTLLTSAENVQLDRQIDTFLRLAGSRLRLMPAIKAIEWLVRRFRIHENNTAMLLMTFLPYHSIPTFATLMSILPSRIPHEFRFLDPYIRSLRCPPRSILVHEAVHHPAFLSAVSEYTLESCRQQSQYSALITFWGGLMTETLSGIIDRTRSGRATVQSENTQALIHRIGPVLGESLVMKKIPSIQIASYMVLAVFVFKAHLDDAAVTAFMEQTVHGWTQETVRPGLICLAIMAQFRSGKQMSNKITKALMKISNIGALLVEIGQERRIDKLANGLCLALIERLTKKSDSRGLPTILAVLESQILEEKQITVIFKSLLLTALKLDDDNDEAGKLRRDLGSVLITLSQTSGKSGDIIQSVIEKTDFDIEQLEMKLDLSFRQRKLPDAAESSNSDMASQTVDESQGKHGKQDLLAAVDELSNHKESLATCLQTRPNALFDEFSHLFFSIVSEQSSSSEAHDRFDRSSKMRRRSAAKECTYCSFYIRIWCGPYPALARMAAINLVKERLKSEKDETVDFQALIPYCLTALSDPSKRVRQATADLMTVLADRYASLNTFKSMTIWGAGALYGKKKNFTSMDSIIAAKMICLQILPSIEECIMDPQHIYTVMGTIIQYGKYQVFDAAMDQKDHLSQSARLAVLKSLGSHAAATPFLLVKDRLLKGISEARGVGSTSRTQVLLPVLQWWASLTEDDTLSLCQLERIDRKELDLRLVNVVVANDAAGLEYLLEILNDGGKREKDSLMEAIFCRLKKMWQGMKSEVKSMVAKQLLDMSQEQTAENGSESIVPGEAADMLRNVELTTDILSFFLESMRSGTKMIGEAYPEKNNSAIASTASKVSPETSQALRRFTFVLQLVEESDPVTHPELLDGLFTALSELQQYKTLASSELGYLENLILRSLLAIMPAYKGDRPLKTTNSSSYGDLLVNCIQSSSSPVVQNSALLLIADLAATAPNLVLHSVMPIFTFMGASVLRQSDDYSAHVVFQTIKEVIPPLIKSLRQGKKSPVAGASDILLSFATAYAHMPAHRRLGMFITLVETLGAREFLFALVGMMVDKYDTSDALLQFLVEVMSHVDIETQLDTLGKLVDVIADLLKAKPGISLAIFGIGKQDQKEEVDKVALRQLSALPYLLSSKALKGEFDKLADHDDMEASQVRRLYSALLQKILLLADTVKDKQALHVKCGVTLSHLLNLLSIGEFIKAVESLLDRQEMGLRHKVLRALEVRVATEDKTDTRARQVLLGFLPQLTAAIRDSSSIWDKHTAVTCVDKIAEKYGKMDVEVVVAAAETIAGESCLGQEDGRLRVMALLCLTSLVDALQDGIVPVLPIAIPKAMGYLESSIEGNEVDEDLHSACFGFLSSMAQHVGYMLSSYSDRLLKVCDKSAEAGLSDDANSSRVGCLGIMAKRLDANDLLTSLKGNWENSVRLGLGAVSEKLDMVGMVIDKQAKSKVAKFAPLLLSILLEGFDMRRQLHSTGRHDERTMRQLDKVEASTSEKALKMVYKLNDAAFRPIFVEMMEWTGTGAAGQERRSRIDRKWPMYGFFLTFFQQLKSIVSSYASYIVDDAVKILGSADMEDEFEKALWRRVVKTLATCFEHDQDEFWQAPAHFEAVAPSVADQLLRAEAVDVTEEVVPAVVELAAAADSQKHQRDLNGRLMRHVQSSRREVRVAAVKCQQALTERLGEEWLSMLHEMLPRISELQEDHDEEVEKETHRWIVKIEGVLGESLDAMLQ
ncbi:hypothetical protein CDD82_4924 [Ophiocordyceps australis]|uniref:U3 small nucleolar RNA-associated protein 10 n=1 Tax=Ophiocordyceps australis TaxID=1399860 RepID=A0A2C5Y4G1_9HYPO|nr:hypothetical protein CDD82_4924 [Ophiocordyceps australis]